LRDSVLVFPAIAGQSAGKYLSLFIDKLQQKIRILVVDILDAVFLEAAVLGLYFSPLYGFIY